MPVTLHAGQIVVRLVLTILAGAVLGLNRGRHGRPAGLRTTLLVCLAASVAMIQANLLMDTVGKANNSFVVLDLMRLPLGILTGIGFIGGGTILRRGSLVVGLTSAATLWFATVIGLCLGGGQIGLGLASTAIAWAVLSGLPYAEGAMRQDLRATMTLTVAGPSLSDEEIRHEVGRADCSVVTWGIRYDRGAKRRQIRAEIQWRKRPAETQPPAFIPLFAAHPDVEQLMWKPQGSAAGIRRKRGQDPLIRIGKPRE